MSHYFPLAAACFLILMGQTAVIIKKKAPESLATPPFHQNTCHLVEAVRCGRKAERQRAEQIRHAFPLESKILYMRFPDLNVMVCTL